MHASTPTQLLSYQTTRATASLASHEFFLGESCKQQRCPGCPRHGGPRVAAGRLALLCQYMLPRASCVTSSKQGTFAWLERLRSLAPRPRLLFPRSLAALLKPAECCRGTTELLALIIPTHPVDPLDEGLSSSPGFASIPVPAFLIPSSSFQPYKQLDRSYLYPRPGGPASCGRGTRHS